MKAKIVRDVIDEKSEKDIYSPEILEDIKSRLGKMRVEDIAYELDIKISAVKKCRREILSEISAIEKGIILTQEQKIEELREKILAGKIKKRPHNYPVGVEGLSRGIVRDLTKNGKSVREIKKQTGLDTSTISYHRRKIKENYKRKYPPRIMNMEPDKHLKVEKLLKKHKRQKDICEILDISSATASTIVKKIRRSI